MYLEVEWPVVGVGDADAGLEVAGAGGEDDVGRDGELLQGEGQRQLLGNVHRQAALLARRNLGGDGVRCSFEPVIGNSFER